MSLPIKSRPSTCWCHYEAHQSGGAMINDCWNMDVATLTMIDVTLPLKLLTHSEADLLECTANYVSSLSFPLSLLPFIPLPPLPFSCCCCCWICSCQPATKKVRQVWTLICFSAAAKVDAASSKGLQEPFLNSPLQKKKIPQIWKHSCTGFCLSLSVL